MLVWALRGFTCRERNLGNCTSISLEVESPSSLKLSDSGQIPVSNIPITILLPVLALLTCWRSPRRRPWPPWMELFPFTEKKNYYHNLKHILSLTQRIWCSSSSLLCKKGNMQPHKLLLEFGLVFCWFRFFFNDYVFWANGLFSCYFVIALWLIVSVLFL